MRTLILTIAYFFLLFSVAKTQTISGTIINNDNGEPVVEAHVIIKGTFTGTYSGKDGHFKLENINQSGQVTLMISHLSFEDQEKTLTLGEGQEADIEIRLSPKAVLADEVIVSSTRAGRDIQTTYTEVGEQEIEKQNLAQDLPYLLDQTPSLVSTSDAGAGVGYTSLRIRGSDQSRINVTINGIPYNDPESQGVFWVDLPDFATSVDNIQIQRGVGTSTNGAGAFGATINVQTTKLNREPYGELSGSYGSFNTWKTSAKFGTGLIKDKFTFDGRLSKISSDGYIDRATSDLKSFFLSGGYYGKKSIFRVNVFSGVEETYQAWWGVLEDSLETNRTWNYYTYDNEVDHYKQDNYQALYSQEIGKHWMLNSALHYTRGKGYFEQYKGPEYNNAFGFNTKQAFEDYGLENVIIGDDTITETSLIRRRWLDNHFYGITLSSQYQGSNFSLTFGGAANRYDGDHYGEVIWAQFASNGEIRHRYYDNTGIKDDINVYAKVSYSLFEKLNLFLDLQYRYVGYEVDGIDNDQRMLSVNKQLHFVNPKAGLAYHINNNHEVYASFAIANREPTRNDYIDAPDGKTPEPEALRNLEVGYKFKRPKNLLGMNYYLMHYKDQLVLTGELNDVGSAIRTNVDKSYRTGIEIYNKLNVNDKFLWNANFAYSFNKIKEFTEVLYVYDFDYNLVEVEPKTYENTDISFSPSIIASSEVTYKPVSGLGLSLISKYVGEQYLDNTSSDKRKLNDYFLNNIRINYTLTDVFFKEIAFMVMVNNIFNVTYESNGYTFTEVYEDNANNQSRVDYNYYYPQAGVNVLGGVTIKF